MLLGVLADVPAGAISEGPIVGIAGERQPEKRIQAPRSPLYSFLRKVGSQTVRKPRLLRFGMSWRMNSGMSMIRIVPTPGAGSGETVSGTSRGGGRSKLITASRLLSSIPSATRRFWRVLTRRRSKG